MLRHPPGDAAGVKLSVAMTNSSRSASASWAASVSIIETGADSYRLATNRARHQRLKQWRGIATRYEKTATSN